MRQTLLVLLLSLPLSAQWETKDVAFEGAVLGSLMVDWAQTLTISRIPPPKEAWALGRPYMEIYTQGPWYETNPVIGKHPSRASINRYFATAMVAHVAVAHFLPGHWRHDWQAATFVLEGLVVDRNIRIGLGCKF